MFAYGVGAGVTRRLFSGDQGGGLSLDTGVRYARGGKAKYLTKGAIDRDDLMPTLNYSYSRTDTIIFDLGVVIGR